MLGNGDGCVAATQEGKKQSRERARERVREREREREREGAGTTVACARASGSVGRAADLKLVAATAQATISDIHLSRAH